MDNKFQNRYRISPARLQNWDYRHAGTYFITICTKGKKYFFGEIKSDGMHLSQTGILADVFWHEIKNHTKEIELGEFIVMPNHIHGILFIFNKIENNSTVETKHALSLPSKDFQTI